MATLIYAHPGSLFQATMENAPTGLEGTVGITIKKPDGTVVSPRTTVGISEAWTGVYTKQDNIAPSTTGTYIVVWDDGAGIEAYEDLNVSLQPDLLEIVIYAKPDEEIQPVLFNAPVGKVGTLAISITDYDGVPVVARTTSGIQEIEPGVYRAIMNAPSTEGNFIIVWDDTVTFVGDLLRVSQIVQQEVILNFAAPNIADLVSLHVYESPENIGPWVEIDSTSDIGVYPAYINQYTTLKASDADDWFSIRWEDSAGNLTDLSGGVIGSSSSFVQQLADRIILRDPSIDPMIARQEAEAVLELVYGTTSPESISALAFSGLTALALGRIYFTSLLTTEEGSSYVAGLVQQKSSSSTSSVTLKAVQDMMKQAQAALGLNYSVVAQMVETPIATGAIVSEDVSRLLVEIE